MSNTYRKASARMKLRKARDSRRVAQAWAEFNVSGPHGQMVYWRAYLLAHRNVVVRWC